MAVLGIDLVPHHISDVRPTAEGRASYVHSEPLETRKRQYVLGKHMLIKDKAVIAAAFETTYGSQKPYMARERSTSPNPTTKSS